MPSSAQAPASPVVEIRHPVGALEPAPAQAADVGAGNYAACCVVEVLPSPPRAVRAVVGLEESLELQKLRAIAKAMDLPPELWVEEYVGKAGGYAIQGRAAMFIEWSGSDSSFVVGLPLALAGRMPGSFGIKPY